MECPSLHTKEQKRIETFPFFLIFCPLSSSTIQPASSSVPPLPIIGLVRNTGNLFNEGADAVSGWLDAECTMIHLEGTGQERGGDYGHRGQQHNQSDCSHSMDHL